MDLLDRLNPKQREAVMCTEGPLLLFAGAGSGKTRTLTYRIAHLIERGVNPYNILAITFTNKAAREMRERIDSIAQGGANVWVSTFHSFCVRILRREIDKLSYDSRFTIYDADDSARLIRNCLKELNVSDKQYPVGSVAGAISGFKNELISVDVATREYATDFRKKTICELYKLYQKKLALNNALDFDDLIVLTVRLFTAREDVLAKYQDRFLYILVDEYQDTNNAQYTLIRLLANKHRNLCVVGDDDQSIYGWRGADMRNILEFEKDYANTHVIKLEQNYRSTQTILNAANAVISHNRNRRQKSLWTENHSGSELRYYNAWTDIEEGVFVADEIYSGFNKGDKFRDFAVLYRNNVQSRVIEDTFVKRGIPYRLLGGVRFYERREIKDIMAYLKFINNPADTISLMRIINVPRRGIGDVTLERVTNYAEEVGLSFFQALYELENINITNARASKLMIFRDLMERLIETAANASAADVVEQVITLSGYKDALLFEKTDEAQDRLANIDELLTKAFEFKGDDDGLAAFLDEVALVADVDGYNENEDAVVLMTLHSSKGLEFKHVFIVGFEEGIFPGYYSATSSDPDSLEEERRLCYVGITRARETLTITTANSRMRHGEVVSNSPSRFLKEIPADLITDKRTPTIKYPPRIATASESKAFRTDMPTRGLGLNIGDEIKQKKYGTGVIVNIKPSGDEYEVAVKFPQVGIKRFKAHLSDKSKAET